MISNSEKRRDIATAFISEMVINLAKQAEKERRNKQYYNELVDAMTMASYILKNVPVKLWRFVDYSKHKGENDI